MLGQWDDAQGDLDDGALDPDEVASDTEPWDEGADDETGDDWQEEEEDD